MAKRKHGYNEKSLLNLRQNQAARIANFRKQVTKEISEKIEIDEKDLEVIIPTKKLFKEDEQKRFASFLSMYLEQFGKEGKLEMSDLVAIATLCKNHILEDRILGEAETVADAMQPVEKLKKENAKLIEQLAATRVQRVDPRAGQEFTIMDIINMYEREEKLSIKERLNKDKVEEDLYTDKIATTVSGLL